MMKTEKTVNERIKELARRVVGKHRNDTAPIWMVDEQIEKFAELIVRECARISVEADYTITNQGEASAQAFMEHFGVK